MSDGIKQVAPNGTAISYPRKLTKGGQIVMAASARAHLQYERDGFVDAGGVTLLKTTFPRTVKNTQGTVLVASHMEALLQYLNDGYSDSSGLS